MSNPNNIKEELQKWINMRNVLRHRIDFMIIIEVINGNLNGDPDAGNMPRIDIETGIGIVTDVCIKHHVRCKVDLIKHGAENYLIYIKNNAALNTKDKEALAAVGLDTSLSAEQQKKAVKALRKDDNELDKTAARFMCKNYYDIRTFGAVMTGFTGNGLTTGHITGPVQLSAATSVEPIAIMDMTVNRCAITAEEEREDGKTNTFGNKSIVPYAVYTMKGHISPHQAAKTGFDEEDEALLWEAILNMFDTTHSAAKGEINVRELIIFKHEKTDGNAHAYELFDSVHIEKCTDEPARKYSDYKITVDTPPAGVELIRMH